jgi:hypothetical protein
VKSIAMRLRRLELAGSPTSLADYELLRRIEAARSRAGATTALPPHGLPKHCRSAPGWASAGP